MARHVLVVDYDPTWPLKFRQEAQKIRAILKDNCAAIYHIGSTSVPGLAAKPVIDIMPAAHQKMGKWIFVLKGDKKRAAACSGCPLYFC